MRYYLDALLPEQLLQRRVRERLAGDERKDQPLAMRESSCLVQHSKLSRSQRSLVLAPGLGSIRRHRPNRGIQIDFPPL